MTPTDETLLPLPAHRRRQGGRALAARRPFEMQFLGVSSARLERAVERLQRSRRGVAEDAAPVALLVDCGATSAGYPALDDDESYTLDLDGEAIRLTAPTEWGILHGLTTLMQLVSGNDVVGALHIDDAPRFAWRGLMLDVARHFLEPAVLLRTLDAMAAFKLNVLHLHLSDDQGFRFPSERYPALASAAHYRRSDLQTLLSHAAERGIRVVPELDMPGHATAWLVAYPEWGNRTATATTRFGVHGACLDPTRPAVRAALAGLLEELAEVFPDAYVHVGGDEVHPGWWTEDASIASYMARHGLTGPAALQAELNAELAATLGRLGRRMLAWDEAVHPQLPGEVTVQAWRGATARDRALAGGHDCVVSAPYYVDLLYPADLHYRFDPAAPQSELLALEDAMLDDPRLAHVAAGMAWTRQWREGAVRLDTATATGRVLGGEACLWAELVDARVLDVRLWSRMPALAERFWSPAPGAAADDVDRRLGWALSHLSAWAGVTVREDVRRLVSEAGVRPEWWPLVAMLEPVKWYARLLGEEALAARLQGREMPQARPYDTDTLLNRVVDGLPPASEAAAELAGLLRTELDGEVTARQRLRDLALTWRDLPADGGPAELAGLAARLSAVGEVMLGVLDESLALDEARRRLLRAAPPQGEYLLAPVPVLADWVEARIARGQG